MSSRCWGFISGIIIGTSSVHLLAELLETTGMSAFAYAASILLMSSFSMSNAQKTKETFEAIFFKSFSTASTVNFPTEDGIGSFIIHLPFTASLYFFPAELGEAATTTTSNQGWL